jgi:restriction system protein
VVVEKGVFITTGKFSDEAISYVSTITPRVILLDGRTLAGYMVDFDLGVANTQIFQIKRIDSDYFIEE